MATVPVPPVILKDPVRPSSKVFVNFCSLYPNCGAVPTVDEVATLLSCQYFKIPVLAYQVSGEYSLIKNGIINKLINDDSIIESLMCFKRAGASAIVSYFALEIAKKIKY